MGNEQQTFPIPTTAPPQTQPQYVPNPPPVQHQVPAILPYHSQMHQFPPVSPIAVSVPADLTQAYYAPIPGYVQALDAYGNPIFIQQQQHEYQHPGAYQQVPYSSSYPPPLIAQRPRLVLLRQQRDTGQVQHRYRAAYQRHRVDRLPQDRRGR